MANVEADTWTAFFFPKGVPQPIVDRLRKAAIEAVETPKVREQLETLGASIVSADRRTPEYLADFVKKDISKWGGRRKSERYPAAVTAFIRLRRMTPRLLRLAKKLPELVAVDRLWLAATFGNGFDQ